MLLQVGWINIRGANPINDQKLVYEAATTMANGNVDELVENQYLELFGQQLTLSTFYAIIFKILRMQTPLILQYLNIIANALTIVGILLITKQLEKKHEVRKINSIVISLSFITLPLLSTFVYGDFIGLPMCLFAIYFIMRYSETKKIKYAFISILFMAIAYVMRKNNLIFIIALSIYLLLDIMCFEKKNVLKGTTILILFVTISILPATAIKKYWGNRLELDTKKAFPTIGFICMGMQEGERAKGWYNASPKLAFEDVESSKQYYKEEIQRRLKTFASKPIYFIKFYAIKTATMWAENTYAALWYNQSYNFGEIEGIKQSKFQQEQTETLDNIAIQITPILGVFQKGIILIIFGCTTLNLIKNRKDISNEILLLVTVFIGGFLFHTIWEAKSRYIIPYIVVLIPIVSLPIDNYLSKIINNIKRNKIRNGEKNEIIDSNSNLQ